MGGREDLRHGGRKVCLGERRRQNLKEAEGIKWLEEPNPFQDKTFKP